MSTSLENAIDHHSRQANSRPSPAFPSAQQLVSKISHDMTLLPGDLIACGTSVGIGVMKEPVNTVTVAIDGIGELTNEFRQ